MTAYLPPMVDQEARKADCRLGRADDAGEVDYVHNQAVADYVADNCTVGVPSSKRSAAGGAEEGNSRDTDVHHWEIQGLRTVDCEYLWDFAVRVSQTLGKAAAGKPEAETVAKDSNPPSASTLASEGSYCELDNLVELLLTDLPIVACMAVGMTGTSG